MAMGVMPLSVSSHFAKNNENCKNGGKRWPSQILIHYQIKIQKQLTKLVTNVNVRSPVANKLTWTHWTLVIVIFSLMTDLTATCHLHSVHVLRGRVLLNVFCRSVVSWFELGSCSVFTWTWYSDNGILMILKNRWNCLIFWYLNQTKDDGVIKIFSFSNSILGPT